MVSAIEGSQAIIWAIGAMHNDPDQVRVMESAAHNLVRAMERSGVRRLVALSGAGITIEGERKPLSGRLMSAFVGRVVRHVVEAKRREYEVISASDLDWTLVRPPRVVDRPATGSYVVGDALVGRSISQGDLADFMVRQIKDRSYIRDAPYVSQ
jgi:putative NADH-flavin reductase